MFQVQVNDWLKQVYVQVNVWLKQVYVQVNVWLKQVYVQVNVWLKQVYVQVNVLLKQVYAQVNVWLKTNNSIILGKSIGLKQLARVTYYCSKQMRVIYVFYIQYILTTKIDDENILVLSNI